MQKTLVQSLDFLKANLKATKDNAPSVFPEPFKNSIFHQKEIVKLNPVAFERLEMAINELEKAAHFLMSAEAALVGFDEIKKSELGLAQNFTHGYIYMLREFVYQSKVRREAAAQMQKVRVA